jgi:arylformamidase
MRDAVFLGYTQDELDRAYDQRVWADNAELVIARYKAASAEARAAVRRWSEVKYGVRADEAIDVFPAGDRAPIHVHIHGGAWRLHSKSDASFPAPAMVDAGMHFVVPNFTNLPTVRMPDMVDQLICALAWIFRNAESFGGDRDRILLSGHSSGAHLAAVLLTIDWPRHGLPRDLVKAALLISGSYDLGPVMLSSRRSYIDLTDDEVARLSPLRHVAAISCPVKVLHGDEESPEFIRQARRFSGALSAAGKHAELIAVPQVNHFEINEGLGKADSPVFAAALSQLAAIEAGGGPVRSSDLRTGRHS